MLRTITIGSTLQVQGIPVGHTPDGRMMMRDGDRVFTGHPLPRWTDGAAQIQRLHSLARDCARVDVS